MIGRLRGRLIYKAPPWLMVDVGGVGYELEAPMSTMYDLPDPGQEVQLFTHYAHKDDGVSLYGFLTDNERRLFRAVQKVSGIGAKIALAILSSVTVTAFTQMLQSNDVTALTRIPGIGKKTAERMMLELRDRVSGPNTDVAPTAGGLMTDDPMTEAVVALQQLGYKPAEALRMVRTVCVQGDDVTTVIRKALQTTLR